MHERPMLYDNQRPPTRYPHDRDLIGRGAPNAALRAETSLTLCDHRFIFYYASGPQNFIHRFPLAISSINL